MGLAFVACAFLGQPSWAKEVIKPTLDAMKALNVSEMERT